VALDDALADREAHVGAVGAAAGGRAMERLEDQLALGGVDPDAVVDDADLPALRGLARGDVHDRRPAPGVLDGVADEVLDQPPELVRPGANGRQRVDDHVRARLPDRAAQAGDRLATTIPRSTPHSGTRIAWS
jgi:hypothetical protein